MSGGRGGGGRAWGFLRETALLVAMALVVAVAVKAFVAQAFYIPSGSMRPQLAVGDRIVVSKLAYDLHEPRRGDIVVFDSPGRPDPPPEPLPTRVARTFLQAVGIGAPSTDEFVKRVVALPGEVVEGRAGDVLVDGRRLVEPYLPPGTVTDAFGPVTVPPGHIWVMGDNRGASADSRVFGPIPESTVVGRAVFTAWPVSRTRFL